jgi:hypothetical protein
LQQFQACHGFHCAKTVDQASHLHNSQRKEMTLKGKKTPLRSSRTVLDAAAPFSWRLCVVAGRVRILILKKGRKSVEHGLFDQVGLFTFFDVRIFVHDSLFQWWYMLWYGWDAMYSQPKIRLQ